MSAGRARRRSSAPSSVPVPLTAPAEPIAPGSAAQDAATRTARELFALTTRVEAGFEDLTARLDTLGTALAGTIAGSTRLATDATARAAASERAAVADRVALTGLLDPLDDLLALLRPTADAAIVSQLERLTSAQLAILHAAGIDELPALGAAFDPRTHDGLSTRPGDTLDPPAAPGTVVELVRRGYRWRDTILRRAQVIIAA